MFIEPHTTINGPEIRNRGWVEVICGPMFSGKTEELIRRVNRAIIAGQKVEIFKPSTDYRYDRDRIVSHNNVTVRSTVVSFAGDILLFAGDCDVVGIDEGQFFDDQLIAAAQKLANQGKRVIISCLNLDFKGNPFGPVPQLLAVAEYIARLHAICVKCGSLASYSYRVNESQSQVLIGEKDYYEARCRECFNKGKNAVKVI